ncbi:MAG: hypothetical protein AAF725_07795, partial [Acidobacteriota bacterium]
MARSDAGFVVVWAGGPTASGREIQGQRFDPDGTAVGAQFRVITSTANDQSHPAAAMDSAGGFVVVWDSFRNAGDRDVRGRRFESNGNPIGNDFRIHTSSAENQFGAAVDISNGSGDFLVAWSREASSSWDVRARRFASDGSPLGSQLSLDSEGGEFLVSVDLAQRRCDV